MEMQDYIALFNMQDYLQTRLDRTLDGDNSIKAVLRRALCVVR